MPRKASLSNCPTGRIRPGPLVGQCAPSLSDPSRCRIPLVIESLSLSDPPRCRIPLVVGSDRFDRSTTGESRTRGQAPPGFLSLFEKSPVRARVVRFAPHVQLLCEDVAAEAQALGADPRTCSGTHRRCRVATTTEGADQRPGVDEAEVLRRSHRAVDRTPSSRPRRKLFSAALEPPEACCAPDGRHPRCHRGAGRDDSLGRQGPAWLPAAHHLGRPPWSSPSCASAT